MYKFIFTVTVLIVSAFSLSAQYQMDITGNYSIPSSTEFKTNYNNGFGVTADIHYFFKESNFSVSVLFGFNSFRGSNEFEQALKDSNKTIFEYDYQINYYTFPVMVSANYTFFYDKKFHVIPALGLGGNFMEMKKKQIGKYTSDTEKEYFNEFAIYPSLGFSYEIIDDVSFLLKSGYNMTLGSESISYIDIKIGIIYKI